MGKTVFAVIMVVVLGLAGLGYYIYNDDKASAQVATAEVATDSVHYVLATSTQNYSAEGATPTGQTVAVTPKKVTQVATVFESSAPFAGYHNRSYGLAVPGSYNVAQTQNMFNDVPNTATLNFYQNEQLAFIINVWSREQWSKLRNEETWNKDNGNLAGTYFGEGTYLGENETWIYSVVPGAYGVPSGIRFY